MKSIILGPQRGPGEITSPLYRFGRSRHDQMMGFGAVPVTSKWLLIGGALAAAYFLFVRKKRS